MGSGERLPISTCPARRATGPGSRHVAWAKAHGEGSSCSSNTDASRMGLTNWLKATDGGDWEMNPETGIARQT
jgi:hypothetical protein